MSFNNNFFKKEVPFYSQLVHNGSLFVYLDRNSFEKEIGKSCNISNFNNMNKIRVILYDTGECIVERVNF